MSKRSEKQVMEAVMMEASKIGARVWRNNVGMLRDKRGTPVRYGLCVGSSDLIGIYKGRMLAIEVKAKGKKATDAQIKFINCINKLGGIAFVCDDEKNLESLLTSF